MSQSWGFLGRVSPGLFLASALLTVVACGTPTGGSAAPPVTGGATAPPTTSQAAASTTEPTTIVVDLCADGGLLLVDTGTEGAMGARQTGIAAVNCTGEPITLSGFPDVELIDGTGEPIPLPPTHGSYFEPEVEPVSHSVTVQPGDSAYLLLSWRSLVLDDAAVFGESIRFTAGPEFPAQRMELAVDLGNTEEFYVSSWTLTPAESAIPTLTTVSETPSTSTPTRSTS